MKKQIIFMAQQLKSGGAEKVIILLANALAERQDYTVSLHIVLKSEPIVPISEKVNVKFLTNCILKKENVIQKCVRKVFELNAIRKNIRKINNSVVISSCNEYSKIISKNTNKTNYIIAQLHNDYTSKLLYDFCNKYTNINLFVLLNETFRKEIEPEMKKKNSFTKVTVIPNFIENIESEDVEKEKIVFSAGRFHWVKGFERLVEVWSLIPFEEKNGWKLVIAGDGEEFEKIKKLIKNKGLENTIILPGRLENDEIYSYMRKSMIYALSSYSEAFPMVLLEAMQNRLPVIAFDVRTGPRCIIKNNETGYLIKDFDNESYAKKLVELMNNTELQQCMGNAAYLESKKYLKKNIIQQWFEIIDNINI